MTEVPTTLACSEVTIRAGQREVLSNFTWEHRPGGVAWLFGSNGSGKSSLLRVLSGSRRPSTGRIIWTGHVPRIFYHAPPLHVPGEVGVDDFLDFVERTATQSAPPALVDAFFPRSIDNGHRFKTLSTGEAKRLMLWGVLRQGDGALMLDEPYEHLSRDAKAALTSLLRWNASRTIVVIATNQDVEFGPGDVVLNFDGAVIEVDRVA